MKITEFDELLFGMQSEYLLPVNSMDTVCCTSFDGSATSATAATHQPIVQDASSVIIQSPSNAAAQFYTMDCSTLLNGSGSRTITVCTICGDRATGKHYGAESCDGCKGFFRRSVRKKHVYTCRFQRKCSIDKDKRNQCRFCRLQKCFDAGMRREAVQNERDQIRVRRPTYADEQRGQHPDYVTVATLQNAEMLARQMCRAVNTVSTTEKQVAANLQDIIHSIQHQLIVMVEWAKYIPVFCQLSLDDQVSLLRCHAGEHLLLSAAYRSLPYVDVVLLGNDTILTKDSVDPSVSRLTSRLLDDVVTVLRDVSVDDVEIACLKAVMFFDPDAAGINDVSRVKQVRGEIQTLLDDYINDRQYEMRGRFGEMLLLLPTLQNISWMCIQQIYSAKLYGQIIVDNLLQEMLLGGSSGSTSAYLNPSSMTSSQTYTTGLSPPHPHQIQQQQHYHHHDNDVFYCTSGVGDTASAIVGVVSDENRDVSRC